MYNIIDKFLLAGDKCMPEMLLKQPGVSACGPYAKKNKKKKNEKAGNARCIYQNELDKIFFLHDLPYGDFKDLSRRTTPDKV